VVAKARHHVIEMRERRREKENSEARAPSGMLKYGILKNQKMKE
jgi:hypothetical protein